MRDRGHLVAPSGSWRQDRASAHAPTLLPPDPWHPI